MRIFFFRIPFLSLIIVLTGFALIFQSFLTSFLKPIRFGFGSRKSQDPCVDRSPTTKTRYTTRRGYNDTYTVIHNYFKAEKHFRCYESITYITHGEWPYFDNLTPLLERWRGPVSFSVYCPGSDFHDAMKRIQFIRRCANNQLVKDFVTFHMIFDKKHSPPKMENMSDYIPSNPELLPVNCMDLEDNIALPPSQSLNYDNIATFRKTMDLKYPINIARNVARENPLTHFVLSSDVELYPSPNPNLIPDFLQMISRANNHSNPQKNKVYVLGVFELHENVTQLPESKRDLVEYLKSGMAVVFHQNTSSCGKCHRLPMFEEWKRLPLPSGNRNGNLNVFHVVKKKKSTEEVEYWQPMFIGTNGEPFYDERMTWEGMGDKISQVFAMCLLDYEFHILDNAFLVHRPGIKRDLKHIPEDRIAIQTRQHKMSVETITQLRKLYGKSGEEKC